MGAGAGKENSWSGSCDAEQRVQVLLGIRSPSSVHERIKKNLDKYGLGKNRTLQNYEKFADINFKNGILGKRAIQGIPENSRNDEILAKYGSLNI